MSWAVRFENVTKRYGQTTAYGATLRDSIANLGRHAGTYFGRRRAPSPRASAPVALDNVTFEVKEGESFALIGPNGAGKTTALKMMSRINYPTSGRIRVRGRVGALIEVGSGVHPDLTGRENIWLYGRIMGLTKQEIARRFDEIVEFSELEHVLDRQVKQYSSGMQLRLGFSIASHIDPDVFVVDEALAVGDASFQVKCVERMTHLVASGKTILFVSHHLPAVESLCRRGVFLNEGRIVAEGDIKSIVKQYLTWTEEQRIKRGQRTTRTMSSNGDVSLEIVAATCHDSRGREVYNFTWNEPIEIRVRFRARQPIHRPHITIGISDGRHHNLITCSTLHRGEQPAVIEDEWIAACTIERLGLMPRVYHIWCEVNSEHGYAAFLADWQEVAAFRISPSEGDPESSGKAGVTFEALGGAVRTDYHWTYRRFEQEGTRLPLVSG